MPAKHIPIFIKSAGVLLLFCAMILFVGNSVGADLFSPLDPVFMISLHNLFWFGGGMALAVSLVCLFGNKTSHQLLWVAWLATNVGVYRVALWANGVHSLNGFFMASPAAFGLSASIAGILADVVVAGLLAGSYSALIGIWLRSRSRRASASPDAYVKISCSSCGGHIAFPVSRTGESITCPHCQTLIVLRKPAADGPVMENHAGITSKGTA